MMPSVSKIKTILSIIFIFTIWGCVSSAYPILLWWSRECVLYLIIIIKPEVWIINHCLGLGHETMVCAVCLTMFLWRRPLSGYFVQLFHTSKKSPTHKIITSGTVCLEIGTFYSLLRRKGWPSTLLCKYILVSMFANIVMILYAYRSMVIAFGVLSRIRQWWQLVFFMIYAAVILTFYRLRIERWW